MPTRSKSAANFFKMGIEAALSKDWVKAMGLFDAAIKEDQTFAETWYNKGMVCATIARNEGIREYMETAVTCFKRAHDLIPTDAEAWMNHGNALAWLDRVEESLPYYKKAIELAPDDMRIWFNYGLALTRMNMLSEAKNAIEKVLEINPNYERAKEILRIIEARMKRQ